MSTTNMDSVFRPGMDEPLQRVSSYVNSRVGHNIVRGFYIASGTTSVNDKGFQSLFGKEEWDNIVTGNYDIGIDVLLDSSDNKTVARGILTAQQCTGLSATSGEISTYLVCTSGTAATSNTAVAGTGRLGTATFKYNSSYGWRCYIYGTGAASGVHYISFTLIQRGTLANLTWAEVEQLALNDEIPLGATKMALIDGCVIPYRMVSRNHYNSTSGKTHTVWFPEMLLGTAATAWGTGSTNNGYHSSMCTIRSAVEGLTIDSKLAAVLKAAKIPCSVYGTSSLSTYTTAGNKLFLPSMCELYGTSYTYSYSDGTQFELFKKWGITTSNYSLLRRVIANTGAGYHWWSRSAYSSNAAYAGRVNIFGYANNDDVTSARRLAPCFCI